MYEFGGDELLEAFWELSTDRFFGFALGPIPRRAIYEYARENGYDVEETEELRVVIRAMDGEFLKHFNKPKQPGETPRDVVVHNEVVTPDVFKQLFGARKKDGVR